MVAVACAAVVVAQMATTIYLPGLPKMGADIEASDRVLQLSVALFVVFAALPVVAWGRAAERFGRVPAFVAAGSTFALASAALALVANPTQLIILRIVQAIGAGGVAVVGRMMVKDLFTGDELAKQLSLLSMAFVVALGGGQVVGGVITSTVGWRWGFALLAVLSAGATLLALRLRLPSRTREASERHTAGPLSYGRTFWLSAATGGIGFAIIVIVQQKSAFVFSDTFDLEPWQFGLFGVLYGLAYFAGATYVHRAVKRVGALGMMRIGVLVILAGSVLLVGLWALDPAQAVGLPVFIAAYVAVTFGQATLFPNSAARAISSVTIGAAMAVSWCAFIQQGLAGVASLLGPLVDTNLAWSVVVAVLALANVALVRALTATQRSQEAS